MNNAIRERRSDEHPLRLTRATKSTLGTQTKVKKLQETILEIRTEYITLAQLLKSAGLIGTGGAAKYFLAETMVRVNGEPEQRRGRKLRPGDLFEAAGVVIRLVAEGQETEPQAMQARELE